MALSLEGMITVAEAARRLGRSQEQVRRYLREGKLRGQRVGGQWFVEEASLGGEYPLPTGARRQIKEAATMVEAKRMTNEEIEALINRIEKNREAIRRRMGGGFTVEEIVEMVKRDREEH